MKKTISLFLAFLFLLSAAGCAPKTDDAPDGDPSQDGMLQDAIAVTDHLDREVTVPAEIERIAVVGVWPLPSVLAIFFNSAEKNCRNAAGQHDGRSKRAARRALPRNFKR